MRGATAATMIPLSLVLGAGLAEDLTRLADFQKSWLSPRYVMTIAAYTRRAADPNWRPAAAAQVRWPAAPAEKGASIDLDLGGGMVLTVQCGWRADGLVNWLDYAEEMRGR